MQPQHNAASPLRLVVRVLQDVTAATTFDSYGDLAEALKTRCARLRIPYDAGLVSEAIEQLEQGGRRPLIAASLPRRRALVERPIVPDPIDRVTATRILKALPGTIRTIPAASWSDPEADEREREAARERAWEMGIEL